MSHWVRSYKFPYSMKLLIQQIALLYNEIILSCEMHHIKGHLCQCSYYGIFFYSLIWLRILGNYNLCSLRPVEWLMSFTICLAVKSRLMKMTVLENVVVKLLSSFHSVSSMYGTTISCTPYERIFRHHQRKSSRGVSTST